MSRFRFRLQRVLDVASIREGVAEQELALSRRKQDDHALLVREIEQTREQATAGLKENLEGELNVRKYQRGQEWLLHLRGRLELEEKTAIVLQREVYEKRVGLIQARREREALDRLKKRHKQRYQSDQGRLEQKRLDENNLLRRARRAGGVMS